MPTVNNFSPTAGQNVQLEGDSESRRERENSAGTQWSILQGITKYITLMGLATGEQVAVIGRKNRVRELFHLKRDA